MGWPKVAWSQLHPVARSEAPSRAVLKSGPEFWLMPDQAHSSDQHDHPNHCWGPDRVGQGRIPINGRANHLDHKATAPFTAVPAAASGTFNPLCKVLCILQSLYLCAIGLKPVFFLAMDTPRTSNCSPKPLYSWMQAAAPRMTTPHSGVQDSILLSWTIPGRFLVKWPPKAAATCSIAHSIC